MPNYPPNDDPLKPWKHFMPPRAKLVFSGPNFMKFVLLAICTVAFVSICFSSFSAGSRWEFNCPGACDNSLVNFQEIRDKERIPRSSGFDNTAISHILFGIGGAEETWTHRRHYCELWWRPNVTRGYVWLDNEPEEWPLTSPPYKVSADTSRFKYTSWGSRSAVRIARILKESFELEMEGVRWFVMGDDDSVFFPENLVAVLNKYDHRQMYYIGSISESVEQDVVHSYTMGYGGGGFAVSYPLAAELVRILDGCIDRYADLYGSDQKVGACVAEIGVPLTQEVGFHQLDIRGSPYGILSAHPLSPLVSLHHLDYLQPLFPGTSRVESVRKLVNSFHHDPTRVLQHTFCYDLTRNWSISIAWGYAIQLYPFILTAKELKTPLQTFLTWRTWSQEPFTFDTRSMALEPCGRPVLYYFDGVKELRGKNKTMSWYTRSTAVKWKQCEMDHYRDAYVVKTFNVSAGFLDPKNFYKAPRRQCCEVVDGAELRSGVVSLKIRDFKKGESITAPI